MRVLLAADQYPEFYNGAGAATERLAAGLARRGHHITVAYPSDDGPGRSELRQGIRDHRITSWRLPHGQGVRVCRPGRAAADIDRLFACHRFDIAHVQSHLPVGRAVVTAARRAGVPVVATNHFMPENLLPHVPVPEPARRWLADRAWKDLAQVFERADLLTTPTQRAADLLTARTGLPPATVISNGIDLSRYAPDSSWADDRSRYVLFVGRLEAEKRVDDLLRGFAAVPAQLTDRLVFIGTGSRHSQLRLLADGLDVADRVEFWGNVSHERLRRAYAECAVFCAPGIAELQSLVTLEAIASGAPVVAADAVALPHLVHHGRNGYTYPPTRPDQISEHLTTILSNPTLRQTMGEQSRRIAADHDIQTTLATFEQHYYRLQHLLRSEADPTLTTLAA